jgi:hypothetical protein
VARDAFILIEAQVGLILGYHSIVPLSSNNLEADAKMLDVPLVLLCPSKSLLIRALQ